MQARSLRIRPHTFGPRVYSPQGIERLASTLKATSGCAFCERPALYRSYYRNGPNLGACQLHKHKLPAPGTPA